MLRSPFWSRFLPLYDAGWTGGAVDMCHPYFDLRIIECLFAIPSTAWLTGKELVRRAMAGSLPRAVCRRPKTSLLADPIAALVREGRAPDLAAAASPAVQAGFVDGLLLKKKLENDGAIEATMRGVSLGRWLGVEGLR